MALQTITSKHQDLQRITIRTPYHYFPPTPPVNLKEAARESDYMQWMDLDNLLVQLLESYAIRTKVEHGAENEERKLEMCEHVGNLLPKIAGRGTIQPGACGGGASSTRFEEWWVI